MQKNHVILRPMIYDDIGSLSTLATNPNVTDTLSPGFPKPYTISDGERYLASLQSQETLTHFAIEYKGVYVGNVSLTLHEDPLKRSAELGYFVGEPYWGNGIATIAVSLITQFAFEQLSITHIFAGVYKSNRASMRVLEKCGYHKVIPQGTDDISHSHTCDVWYEICVPKEEVALP